jgi:hypothetical protein
MPKHDPTHGTPSQSIADLAPSSLVDDLIANQRAERLKIIEQLDLIATMARQPSTADRVPGALQKLAYELRKLP